MTRTSDFSETVARDFPDGFLASFDTPDRETRGVLHVINIDVDPNSDPTRFAFDTAEDIPGKVFEFTLTDYEIVENEPRQAKVTVAGRDTPMIWSDNMSDDLRKEMRAARDGGTDLSDEEDPPLRKGPPGGQAPPAGDGDVLTAVLDAAKTPEDNVEVTPEQAADPAIAARVAIGDLLDLPEEDPNA